MAERENEMGGTETSRNGAVAGVGVVGAADGGAANGGAADGGALAGRDSKPHAASATGEAADGRFGSAATSSTTTSTGDGLTAADSAASGGLPNAAASSGPVKVAAGGGSAKVAASSGSTDAAAGGGSANAAASDSPANAAVDLSRRYLRPTRSTNIFNNMVAFLTRCGISILGSRVLYVRGRKSGEWRSLPVNLLTIDGERYLVSPRGHSQWVRNIRVTGYGELHVGRRVEKFVPHELADDDKPAILRAYLRRWKFEVGMFFDGVDATASDEVLRGIAPGYPVFRITTAQ